LARLLLEKFESFALDPLDLELKAAECVTLAGPSGSGKSLLLRAIADLDPHGGDAMINGQHQSELPAPRWRSLVGLLPAESHWWEDRVGDHFPDPDIRTLQQLGFDDSVLGWEVARLSSGERQRLSLARLLCGRPQALLLDEPTANLDQLSVRSVERLIAAYRQQTGAAVLWVSHDPEQRPRVGSRGFLIRNRRLELEPWT
jgi:ABC-type iron transport system FetAB ATPase subunit